MCYEILIKLWFPTRIKANFKTICLFSARCYSLKSLERIRPIITTVTVSNVDVAKALKHTVPSDGLFKGLNFHFLLIISFFFIVPFNST